MRARLGLIALLLAVSLVGCTSIQGGGSPSSSSIGSMPACQEAESAKDCGGISKLVEAAKKEGKVNIPGDPDNSPFLKQIEGAFTREYGIEVNWVMPGASTEEQLRRAVKPTKERPDVFSLDPSAAPPPTDRVAAYRVADFRLVDGASKEPTGRWVYDYAGVMAVGYNAGELGDADSLKELVGQGDLVKLSVPGDPRTTASTAHALLMLDSAVGPKPTVGAGVAYLQKLADAGQLSDAYANLKSMRHGQTVVLDWNYMQDFYTKRHEPHDIRWKYFVPPGAEIVASHGLAINADALHPAAGRLWEEFMFTGRIQELLSDGGAMPTLFEFLKSDGSISRGAGSALPFLTARPHIPSSAELADARARAATVWNGLFAEE